MTVTSRLLASPVSGVAVWRGCAVMSVPAPSGFHELRMRTGMLRSTAGRIVLGCSTFAPKYASSAASANDRLRRRGAATRSRAGRPSACRPRRSRSESRARRCRRRRARRNNPIRRARASSCARPSSRRRSRRAPARGRRREPAAPSCAARRWSRGISGDGPRVLVVGDDGTARIDPFGGHAGLGRAPRR